MPSRSACPSCGARTTVRRLLFALRPWNLRCPACGTRYGATAATWTAIVAYAVALCATTVLVLAPWTRGSRLAFVASVVGVGFALAAVACALVLRFGTMRPKRGPEDPRA